MKQRKLLRGSIFFLLTVLFSLLFILNSSETAFANRKTKTFKIYGLQPGAILEMRYIYDYTQDILQRVNCGYGQSNSLTLNNNNGSLSISIDNNGVGTVSINGVNMEYYTTYLFVTAGNRAGYAATGWTPGPVGSNGMDDGLNDNQVIPNKWTDNSCLQYCGVAFAYDWLEVKWTLNSYELITDFNGATSTTDTVATYDNWLTYDQPINYFGSAHTLPYIARTGYTFCGWYCYNADWTEVMLWDKYGVPQKNVKINGEQWSDENGNYKWPNGGTRTYAKWTPTKYSATFSTGSGKWADNTATDKTVNYYITSTLNAPETPTRTGYTFAGWKVVSAGVNWTANKVYSNNTLANASGYYGNVAFEAQWTTIKYSATFIPNDGGWTDGSTAYKAVNYYITSTLNAPETPTRIGYTFAGWKVISAGGNWTANKVYSNNTLANASGYYGNVAFEAQWEIIQIEWTASLSKMSGTAAFGDKLLETSSYYGTMASKIKSTFGIKKNIVSTGYTNNTPNPLVFYKMGSYADDYLYIYTKLHAGNFDTISYKFCPEIESLVAQKNPSVAFSDLPYSNASDKSNYLSIRLPYEHMEVGKVYWVEVTGRFGTVERTQTLYFKYDKFDMSTVKYVISKQ